jgi:hypothetical protein
MQFPAEFIRFRSQPFQEFPQAQTRLDIGGGKFYSNHCKVGVYHLHLQSERGIFILEMNREDAFFTQGNDYAIAETDQCPV